MAKLMTCRHGKRFSRVELCESDLSLTRSGTTIGLRVHDEDKDGVTRSYILEISKEELDRIIKFSNETGDTEALYGRGLWK